jgi:putative endonuclease
MEKNIGKIGEEMAVQFLKEKGYQILDRNYKFQIPGHFQRGEIDIVAKKEDVICFVEVKLLKDPKVEIFPEEKVNFSKSRKIIFSAQHWLSKNNIPLNTKWQIDVISVIINKGQKKIFHFENCFSDLKIV